MMEFDKLITDRYSVRKFLPEHLNQDDIDKILEAGHIAPTGCNYQPQRILVLNTDESINKLKNCTKCHFNAPTAMLICYNENESWKRVYDGALSAPVDAVIVTTHMMLKAHDLGIGSCWVMHFNPAAMKEAYNIPENVQPVALLVMGKRAPDSMPIDMHYKKRPIDDVVRCESF